MSPTGIQPDHRASCSLGFLRRHAKSLSRLDRLRQVSEHKATAPLPSGKDAARAAVEAWRKPVEAPRPLGR